MSSKSSCLGTSTPTKSHDVGDYTINYTIPLFCSLLSILKTSCLSGVDIRCSGDQSSSLNFQARHGAQVRILVIVEISRLGRFTRVDWVRSSIYQHGQMTSSFPANAVCRRAHYATLSVRARSEGREDGTLAFTHARVVQCGQSTPA